jgi:hypothetical protein
VRWDDLFGDLEREWEALGEGDRRAEVAERTRAEFAQVPLVDRLRGALDRDVAVRTLSGHDLTGRLARVGADFLLLGAPRREWVVPVHALAAVRGLAPQSVDADLAGPVAARLGLASMLRRVAADRSVVAVVPADGRVLSVRLQRVGADFVELTEADPEGPGGGPRRPHAQPVTLPFAALSFLCRETVET